MRTLARLSLIALCVLTLVAMLAPFVNAAITYETKTYLVPGTNFNAPRFYGFNLSSMPGATSPWIAGVYCYNSSAALLFNVSSGTFIANSTSGTMSTSGSWFFWNTTPDNPVGLVPGSWYYAMCGRYETGYSSMYAGEINSDGNYTNGTYFQIKKTAMTWDGSFGTGNSMYSIQAVMFGNGTGSATPTNYTLTLMVNDLVDGSAVSGFCVNITSTNTTTPYQYLCNTTGTTISSIHTFASGNITFLNITDGHSVPTYFNTSNTSVSFTADKTLYGLTYQALLDVSAYRLFLNTSITTLNVSNQRSTNFSATAPVRVMAVNGSNNVQVAVAGNYTVNTTCTVSTPLSTVSCNATNIYDARLTIGGKFGSTSIQNFSITLTNASLLTNTTNTTTHAIIMNLLQGYGYYTSFNASGYSLANATITPVAASTTYNFSVLVQNSFNLTFYNETTNTVLTNVNITVEFISDDYANNYTTQNGSLEVSLLVPSDYTIRYWMDEDVPRDYYVTLTPQSYNNLELYVVDTGISNYYIPVVTDQNTNPVAACQISLLRAYILSDNSYEYKVVEMEKTDTNGRAVFRVVPNVINYKFVFVCGSATFTTQPTKFTDSTNGYRINLLSDPLESQIAIRNVSATLSFNNATSTYTFTWVDTNNIVEQGCLVVSQTRLGVSDEVNNACSSGSTGSLIYTINDTNNTKYVASGYLETTTTYSTYYFGPYSVDYTSAVVTFGIVGLIATLLVFITFAFMGNESGVETMIIGGIIAIVVMGVLGFITSSWEAIIGIIIIGGIIVYRTRK